MRELALIGANLALVILDASKGISKEDEEIIKLLEYKQIPYGVFINKTDIGKTNIDEVYKLCNPKFVISGSVIKKEGLDDIIYNILNHSQ
ncbi:protein of unknown function [Methanocaldococcus lauensis]|nr:protein of unknown function [Methanocaldococcus lauensis]